MDHFLHTGNIPATVNPQDSGGVLRTRFWGKHQRRDGTAGGGNPNCGDGNIFVGLHRPHGNQLLFGQHIILGRTFQVLFSEFYAGGRRKLCLAVDRQPLLSAWFAEDGVFISGVFVALLIKLWYDGNEKR